LQADLLNFTESRATGFSEGADGSTQTAPAIFRKSTQLFIISELASRR
jgi:hypothetical protein